MVVIKAMTRKLYYEDLYQTEFDAAVLSQQERPQREEPAEGGVRVTLDATLFYPGGGGQPCDLGTLGGRNVLDVVEEGDVVVHVLDGPLPEGEARVHGVIDWDRRFELMQQHLGQHLLAAVLHNRFDLHTNRMRIEGENVSMDFDGVHVEEGTVREAEAEANDVIYKNIPVKILYPNFEEVQLHARKLPPKTSEPIRIVKVGDVDYVPCCGLHVRNTGEVGIIKVTALENHKGGTRVHLRCGRPAYRWLEVVCHEARQIQLELTCAPDRMFERVLFLKEEIRDLKARNEALLNRAAAGLAEELKGRAERVGDYSLVAHIMKDAGQDDIKRLFRALTEHPGVVALLGSVNAEGVSLAFGCNRGDKKIDVRGAFQKAISMVGGKGGGAPFQAMGQGHDAGQIQAALDAAGEVLRQTLA
ncbi:MAG: hypothetical protein IJU98_04080 [Synergistaceae bacterium]|nr:hypothetical protein [Synergistaceae bacterium]